MTGPIARKESSGAQIGAIRYAGAVVATACGVIVGLWLRPLIDPTVVFLTAVLTVAWFSGLLPALLSSVLATLALDYFFTPPLYTLTAEFSHAPRLAAFTLVACLFAGTSAGRRRAERSLQEARNELDAKVHQRTAQLEAAHTEAIALAGRLIDAQEQERSRIGRELHDHISQMLGVLTIRIDQLRGDETTPPPVAAVLEELRRSTAEITADIHSLSHRLHSSALDYLGLVPALQRLVNEFSPRHGIVIDFTHASIPASLPSEVALCLFRVTEESLANVAKHSHAKSARVLVSGAPDGIHLTIEDAGTGFDPVRIEHQGGLGLVSMRERLRAVRGTVHVDSSPSRGTRIDVWVPAASLRASAPGDGASSRHTPSNVSSA